MITKFDLERKRFETFWESTFPFEPQPEVFARSKNGRYTDSQTHSAWLTWHAAKQDATKHSQRPVETTTAKLKIDLERLLNKHADDVKAAAKLCDTLRGKGLRHVTDKALNELVELLEVHEQHQRAADTEPMPGKLLPDCG